MKLWKISQDNNNDYDTYSDAIVHEETKEDAKNRHPNGNRIYNDDKEGEKSYGTWCRKEFVKVEYIGKAKSGLKRGVICTSFHAG